MRIADDLAHSALVYVAALSRAGYLPTANEFNVYVANPRRRVKTSGGMLIGGVLGDLRRTAALAVYGTSEPEPVLDWLRRLRWLRIERGRIVITDLGRAVLRSLEEADETEDLPTEVVLDPDDQLSYARVVVAIFEAGPGALVDAYFSMESLLDIAHRTKIDRVLVLPAKGSKDSRLVGLQQAVAMMKFDRPFEVRSSDAFHDRFVIPDNGPVRFIGTSLTGIGRRIALTGKTGASTSEAIRERFEREWRDANILVAAKPEASAATPTSPTAPHTKRSQPKKPAPRKGRSQARKKT